MKKIISICLLIIFLFTIIPNYAMAKENDITIIINGKLIEIKDKPVIINNRTIVPLRVISEELGYNVKWNHEKRTVTLENEENTLLIGIDKEKAIFNGKPLIMDVKPFIKNGTTYVSLRFISEAFNKEVKWDNKNRIALVGDYTKGDYIKDENYFKYNSSKYGFSIKIPNNLKDKLIIKESENGVEFYDKYNYEINENLGSLFIILKTQNTDILEVVPSYVLKYDKGFHYIAAFASDVQYIVGNEESEKSYSELVKASKNFLRSFALE